jgi:hypothetical protein
VGRWCCRWVTWTVTAWTGIADLSPRGGAYLHFLDRPPLDNTTTTAAAQGVRHPHLPPTTMPIDYLHQYEGSSASQKVRKVACYRMGGD